MSSSDDPSPPQEKKQMSSSDDQSPQEKKQKLEKDDDFFIPHYDRETYYKRLNDNSISFLDHQNRLSDEDCDFTEEEAKLYHDAIEASDVNLFFCLLFLHLFHSHILKFHNIY